jgi:hypothetical protein
LDAGWSPGEIRHGCEGQAALIPHLIGKQTGLMQSLFEQVFRWAEQKRGRLTDWNTDRSECIMARWATGLRPRLYFAARRAVLATKPRKSRARIGNPVASIVRCVKLRSMRGPAIITSSTGKLSKRALAPHLIGQSAGPMRGIFEEVFRWLLLQTHNATKLNDAGGVGI